MNRIPRPKAKDRKTLIEAVTTPLAFIVLALLVIEGSIVPLAVYLPDFRAHLIWTAILCVPGFVLLVAGLAAWKPEALFGERRWQEVYPSAFAADLYLGISGALGNLESAERTEAWVTVAEVITSNTKADGNYQKFCIEVAARLTTLADLTNVKVSARGPIEPALATENTSLPRQ